MLLPVIASCTPIIEVLAVPDCLPRVGYFLVMPLRYFLVTPLHEIQNNTKVI